MGAAAVPYAMPAHPEVKAAGLRFRRTRRRAIVTPRIVRVILAALSGTGLEGELMRYHNIS